MQNMHRMYASNLNRFIMNWHNLSSSFVWCACALVRVGNANNVYYLTLPFLPFAAFSAPLIRFDFFSNDVDISHLFLFNATFSAAPLLCT